MRVFFDTSALAKLFVPEAGTDEMNAMLAQDGMEIWVSALAPLEFHSLAWRRHREGKLDATRVTALLDTLDEQLHEWQVIGLTPGALLEDGPATFGCADTRLCAVAALRGHATFNPVASR